MRRNFSTYALVGVVIAMASCAPKALLVNESSEPRKKQTPRASGSSSPAAVAEVPKKSNSEATFSSVPTPAAQQAQPTAKRTTPAAPLPARGNGDGLRMPDMLGLPQDKELKSSGSSGSGGAVIARPPSE